MLQIILSKLNIYPSFFKMEEICIIYIYTYTYISNIDLLKLKTFIGTEICCLHGRQLNIHLLKKNRCLTIFSCDREEARAFVRAAFSSRTLPPPPNGFGTKETKICRDPAKDSEIDFARIKVCGVAS
jgi:hypothetical protein